MAACAGALAAALVLTMRTADPGRGRGGEGSLRGDLDLVEAALLVATAEQARTSEVLLSRLDAVEARLATLPAAEGADAQALGGVLDDLGRLRDAVRGDLAAADARLAAVERRLAEVIDVLPAARSDTGAPPTDEQEAVWVNLARDPEPLRRFSAIERLGLRRTDRSVRASTDALDDSDAHVVWQALRNLGAFGERSAAGDVVRLLDHPEAVVRHAAWEALVRMGAPESGFEAVAPPEERAAAVRDLRKWAEDL